jgi:hypothetical protein
LNSSINKLPIPNTQNTNPKQLLMVTAEYARKSQLAKCPDYAQNPTMNYLDLWIANLRQRNSVRLTQAINVVGHREKRFGLRSEFCEGRNDD